MDMATVCMVAIFIWLALVSPIWFASVLILYSISMFLITIYTDYTETPDEVETK